MQTTKTWISLYVSKCSQRTGYVARFATDEQAAAFLRARLVDLQWNTVDYGGGPIGDYAFEPIDTELWPAEAPLTMEILCPTCEHGLSLNLCHGPQHYPYDSDELAHYGF